MKQTSDSAKKRMLPTSLLLLLVALVFVTAGTAVPFSGLLSLLQ